MELGGAHREQRPKNRHEAKGIDPETSGYADERDDDAGYRRSQDATQVVDGGVERHGIADVGTPDEFDRKRLTCRSVKGGAYSEQGGEKVEVPQVDNSKGCEQRDTTA